MRWKPHVREAGLLGSMGRVASSVGNSMIESFWSTMQRELLDRHDWTTKTELASAMFEWIEGCYNPIRRHTSIGNLAAQRSKPFTPRQSPRHDHHTDRVRRTGSGSPTPSASSTTNGAGYGTGSPGNNGACRGPRGSRPHQFRRASLTSHGAHRIGFSNGG